jgi:hypothetical protein
MPGTPPRRWVGGANVPTRGGYRVNAGMTLAELLFADGAVELRLRGPLARLTRAESFKVIASDLGAVFPIRSASILRFRGVGFRRHDGREYYFKTARTDEILGVLDSAGFPVTPKAQPATKIWRSTP